MNFIQRLLNVKEKGAVSKKLKNFIWPAGQRISPEAGKINILFYNDFFGLPRTLSDRDHYPGCHFFTDKQYMEQADAVIFHLPGFSEWNGLPKPPGQIWIAETHESDLNYPHQSDEKFMARFDLVGSYHRDADVYLSYLPPIVYEDLFQPISTKTEKEPVSCFISNGNGKQHGVPYRNRFMRELGQHIPVAFYGSFNNNRHPGKDLGRETKLKVIARHKFHLAFENAHDHDYVSEKFLEGFVAGTVPIYSGAPNVRDFAPGDHCFIDVNDYKTPQALAEYLHELDRNDEAYEEYFAWKQKPLSSNLLDLFKWEKRSGYSRMAEHVVKLKQERDKHTDAF